jgi:hypothetical protein
MKRWAVVLALFAGFGVATASRPTAQSRGQDPPILGQINQINRQLAASGLNIAVEQVEFFTLGAGRPRFESTSSRFVGLRTTHDVSRMATTSHTWSI